MGERSGAERSGAEGGGGDWPEINIPHKDKIKVDLDILLEYMANTIHEHHMSRSIDLYIYTCRLAF